EDIPESIINREKDIYSEQAKATGKPDNVVEKIVNGKLNKYFQENCLMEQVYIKDSDKKIKDLVTETIATLGENITLNRYSRFAVGETD
ncbi:MAG: elongation factor Ts, partial [Candidatus Marinimicrobia bacterium]|nr:elongation factor Ts [Candidatus Neomarinimicrobiota bacterium]